LTPPSSPLAPIKSTIKTFWYWLTQVYCTERGISILDGALQIHGQKILDGYYTAHNMGCLYASTSSPKNYVKLSQVLGRAHNQSINLSQTHVERKRQNNLTYEDRALEGEDGRGEKESKDET